MNANDANHMNSLYRFNATNQAEPPVPSASPITLIRERIEELRRQHANYAAYQADRVREQDHHGAWDVAINLSETECEIAGLEFALRAMGVSE